MAGGKVVGVLFIPFDLRGASCKEKQHGRVAALHASEAEGKQLLFNLRVNT